MSARILSSLAAIGILTACAISQDRPPTPSRSFDQAQWDKGIDCHIVSGPFTHANLTIFLLHGPDMHPGAFITLQEALEKKFAVVNETGEVNQLTVENLSPELDIFLQAGDIVKGGKQDRVIASDLVVPAKTGKEPVKVAIESFCVEHGRWRQRGAESAAMFDVSNKAIAGKDLKRAVAGEKSQEKVWKEVAKCQSDLMARLGSRVQSEASPTSLQLTLEDKKLTETMGEFMKDLGKIADNQKDVIGMAYAVNGKMSGAEVYGTHLLFEKLWPKLLQATIVEAITEQPKEPKSKEKPKDTADGKSEKDAEPAKSVEPLKTEFVIAFLNDAANGKVTGNQKVGPRVRVVSKETDKYLSWESRDLAHKETVIHRSYLVK